jgi:hypothetical protein
MANPIGCNDPLSFCRLLCAYSVVALSALQEIPHTATGKVSKLALRKMFANHTPKIRSRQAQPRSKL